MVTSTLPVGSPPHTHTTHPRASILGFTPRLHAHARRAVFARAQIYINMAWPDLPHTHIHIHRTPTPAPFTHTSKCTRARAPPGIQRSRLGAITGRYERARSADPHPYATGACTHPRTPSSFHEPRRTYWVPRCEAGRSVLPRAPNGICIHASPQPRARARGRGWTVPFPKLGAGARSAAAPGRA